MLGFRSPSEKTLLPVFGQPVPRSGAAAIRAEVEADLEAAVRVTLINLVVALDPNLAFRVSAAGMDDRPRAALPSPTTRHIYPLRLPPTNSPQPPALAS